MEELKGKVAFVTGGANGIGLGMVRAFLEEGMKVAVADWSADHIAKASNTFAGNNALHFVRANVADRDSLKDAVDETIAAFGKIHVLCNNAGVNGGGVADDPEFDSWDKAMAVNLGGVINGTKLIVPVIKAQGEGGHVVCTSSMAGIVPLPGLAAYSTAKYAVRGFAESLRMQLAPLGIGVSCLFPGATRTGMLSAPEDDPAFDSAKEASAGDFQKALWDAARAAVDPQDTGRAVVKAIKENSFYIFTNGEFLDEVKQRNREMEEAFPKDPPPEGRKRFETMRAEIVQDLMAVGNRPVASGDAGSFGLDLNSTAVD